MSRMDFALCVASFLRTKLRLWWFDFAVEHCGKNQSGRFKKRSWQPDIRTLKHLWKRPAEAIWRPSIAESSCMARAEAARMGHRIHHGSVCVFRNLFDTCWGWRSRTIAALSPKQTPQCCEVFLLSTRNKVRKLQVLQVWIVDSHISKDALKALRNAIWFCKARSKVPWGSLHGPSFWQNMCSRSWMMTSMCIRSFDNMRLKIGSWQVRVISVAFDVFWLSQLRSRVNLQAPFRGTGFSWHRSSDKYLIVFLLCFHVCQDFVKQNCQGDFETWHAEDGMPRPRSLSAVVFLDKNVSWLFKGPFFVDFFLSISTWTSCYRFCLRRNTMEHSWWSPSRIRLSCAVPVDKWVQIGKSLCSRRLNRTTCLIRLEEIQVYRGGVVSRPGFLWVSASNIESWNFSASSMASQSIGCYPGALQVYGTPSEQHIKQLAESNGIQHCCGEAGDV